MKTMNVNACDRTMNVLTLGRQGESGARKVVFDLSGFIRAYGEGTATLIHQRSSDAAPYIVTTSNTDTLEWDISETDTIYAGEGKAELRYAVGNSLAKSVTAKTIVIASITGDIVIPEALQSWYDAMIDYINTISIDESTITSAITDYLVEHPIEAPVTSVNGKTGQITLSAEDVGAVSVDNANTMIIETVTQYIADHSTDLKGEDGTTYTPKVGTVTTLDAGTDATAAVHIEGTNAVFDFGIPKGCQGEAGSGSDTVWTTPVKAYAGATSVTLVNSLESTNIAIEPFNENTNGTPVAITGSTVTTSAITLYFAEISVDNNFTCKLSPM